MGRGVMGAGGGGGGSGKGLIENMSIRIRASPSVPTYHLRPSRPPGLVVRRHPHLPGRGIVRHPIHRFSSEVPRRHRRLRNLLLRDPRRFTHGLHRHPVTRPSCHPFFSPFKPQRYPQPRHPRPNTLGALPRSSRSDTQYQPDTARSTVSRAPASPAAPAPGRPPPPLSLSDRPPHRP